MNKKHWIATTKVKSICRALIAIIIAIFFGFTTNFLWSKTYDCKKEKEFLISIKNEVEINNERLRFYLNETLKSPLYGATLETQIYEVLWPLYVGMFGKSKNQLEEYYRLIKESKEDVDRQWYAASLGQNELASDLFNAIKRKFGTALELSSGINEDLDEKLLRHKTILGLQVC